MPLRTSRGAPVDAALAATLIGALATTAVLILPALRPGYALYLDHIAVPDPAAPDWNQLSTAEGLRAWPLSGVTWAWSQALPTWTFQHLTLLVAVVGAGLGVGLLLRRWGWGAALAGSLLATANPYVVERLLLGQGALLLTYAVLPWILLAGRAVSPRRRVAFAALVCVPAALTPWGGVVAGAWAVGGAVARRRRRTEVMLQATVSLGLCLPWLIPAVRAGSPAADPDGAAAFRLADGTGMGTLPTALTGGGVWSDAARVGSTGWLGMGVTVVALALAALGVWAAANEDRRLGVLLGATWTVPPLVTALLSGPALGVWTALQSAPAVALFRDVHRLLAPSVLAFVLLLAIGLRHLIRSTAQASATAAGVLHLVLPLSLAAMLVPTAPARLHDAYRPAPFSAEWPEVVAATSTPGRVLTLPWQPLRRADWMAQTFLDPTARAFGARTVAETALTVRRDGHDIQVRDERGEVEDTLDRALTVTGYPVPSELLTSSGIAHILIWRQTPGIVPERPQGWDTTFSGADFTVWSVRGAATR